MAEWVTRKIFCLTCKCWEQRLHTGCPAAPGGGRYLLDPQTLAVRCEQCGTSSYPADLQVGCSQGHTQDETYTRQVLVVSPNDTIVATDGAVVYVQQASGQLLVAGLGHIHDARRWRTQLEAAGRWPTRALEVPVGAGGRVGTVVEAGVREPPPPASPTPASGREGGGAGKGRDGSIILGVGRDGAPIHIAQAARSRSTYVIGITGTGKSTMLEQIAYQDMANGHGLLFLDPHSDSADRLLACVPPERVGDVILWDPADVRRPEGEERRFFGLNPFECSDPTDPRLVDQVADYFIAALSSITDFATSFETAPHMRSVLRNLAIAFAANQDQPHCVTLAHAWSFLQDADMRQAFYPALDRTHPQVREYWERIDELPPGEKRDAVRSTLNKLEPFRTTDTLKMIFGQRRTSLDLRVAMNEGKIVIVPLSEADLTPDVAGYLGAFLTFQLLRAAKSRRELPGEERRPFHLIADEFQTFMSTAFPRIIEEARKFGLDTVVAHQSREQLFGELRDRVRAVGNLIVFRVTHPNAADLAGEFAPEPTPVGPPRQEFGRELVVSVLNHLDGHGHRDPKVVQLYLHLRRALLHQMERVQRLQHANTLKQHEDEREFKLFYEYGVVDPNNVGRRHLRRSLAVDQRRNEQRVHGIIDDYLHGAMRAGPRSITVASSATPQTLFHARLAEELVDAFGVVHEILCLLYEAMIPEQAYRFLRYANSVQESSYTYNLRFVRSEAADPDEFELSSWDLVGDPPDLEAVLRGLAGRLEAEGHPEIEARQAASRCRAATSAHDLETILAEMRQLDLILAELAVRLRDDPAYVMTGQLEPVLEKPQTAADARDVFANTLVTLPDFHAHAKLRGKAGPEVAALKTLPLDVPTEPQRAEEIITRSRLQHGERASRITKQLTECAEEQVGGSGSPPPVIIDDNDNEFFDPKPAAG